MKYKVAGHKRLITSSWLRATHSQLTDQQRNHSTGFRIYFFLLVGGIKIVNPYLCGKILNRCFNTLSYG
jgi:hypothetical protein